jgi:hypothetical protein
MKRILAVLLAGLCASAAMAGPHDHRSTSTVTTVVPGVNVVVVDRNHDRHRRDGRRYAYRDDHRRACPPGLAKKHNGCMPPGQAKKHHDRDHYGYRNDRRQDHDRYGYRDDRHDRVARW